MRRPRLVSVLAAAGLAAGLTAVPAAMLAPAVAAVGPDSITAPGSFNAAAGCPGDWQPECEEVELAQIETTGVFTRAFDLPAGGYGFKITKGGSWDTNWGTWGNPGGGDIPFTTDGTTTHVFYENRNNFAFADNRADLYTVRGNFQSEVGCTGDWDADGCLATVMFPQANGTLRYQTDQLPAGSYEFKVGLGTGWGQAWPGENATFTTNANELITITFDPATNEVGVEVANPPLPGSGQQRAIWLDATTIAWPTSLSGIDGTYELVGRDDVTLTPRALTAAESDRDWRTRSGYIGLALTDTASGDPISRDAVAEILKGSIEIVGSVAGVPVAQTGAQLAPVLDAIYAAAADADLGVVWTGGAPSLRVWAPTATDVALQVWPGTGAADAAGNTLGDPTVIEAVLDPATGVWTADDDAITANAQYLWQVEVFVPSVGDVVENVVTDPYSVGLTINSQRSVVVDLTDSAWAPAGWSQSSAPTLRNESEQTIYELHIRDFSAWDETVPTDLRGTYKAFTLPDTDGVNHLRGLEQAGITTLHLLPSFDIATTTINELRSEQVVPTLEGIEMIPENLAALAAVPGWGPAAAIQQAAVFAVTNRDAFNWGYDPFHWTTPEGSYATNGNQVGGARGLEYREMVSSLHDLDLRVVQDVVYNHTAAAGQSGNSVLDRVVPGYYQRLNANGGVENSTCCSNTATENTMAGKMMVDSVLTYAKDYRIDGFRFDLMGHHTLQNMIDIREALDELTVEADGVDGKDIYLYGEGWNFGEVQDDRLFEQATQLNIAGTDIGTFNDRLRDAVRGGGPFDPDQRTYQGFGSGQYTDPNATATAELSEETQLAQLLHNTDLIRIGLAGSLKDYEFLTASGEVKQAQHVDYNGQPAGYVSSPQEAVNYVEAHDNETLFDNSVWKLPTDASMDTRVRSQVLSNATVLLGQSPAFLASGTELLRSKSLDRDSYNSGDWFNAIDWTGERNTFGTGLPGAEKNADKWDLMRPLLADEDMRPDAAAMAEANALVLEFLELRSSTPLFTLGSADLVKDSVTFPNAGPEATPGLLVMAIADTADVDPELDRVLVVFNASPEAITEEIDGFAGIDLGLHPIQAEGADDAVKGSAWNATTGAATVPAWTTAVFVAADDTEPPVSPSPSPSPDPDPDPDPDPSTETSTGDPTGTSTSGSGSGGGLPGTGANVGLLVLLAAGLLGAGTLLQLRRRRMSGS